MSHSIVQLYLRVASPTVARRSLTTILSTSMAAQYVYRLRSAHRRRCRCTTSARRPCTQSACSCGTVLSSTSAALARSLSPQPPPPLRPRLRESSFYLNNEFSLRLCLSRTCLGKMIIIVQPVETIMKTVVLPSSLSESSRSTWCSASSTCRSTVRGGRPEAATPAPARSTQHNTTEQTRHRLPRQARDKHQIYNESHAPPRAPPRTYP